MTVHEIGSKITISIEPQNGLSGREVSVFQSAHNVFGSGTVSIFIGIEDGVTVIRIVGYEHLNQPESFQKRLESLNELLNEK